MLRTFLWVLGGMGLGVVVHLVVILTLPTLADESVFDQMAALNSFEKMSILPEITAESANEMRLDPELIYGVCQLDLEIGVGVINALLPDGYWSVAIFDATGRAVYGMTNRSSAGQMLQLGIFNPEQTKRLANQQLDIAEGLLIVESDLNDLFVVVRAAPPHRAMRHRYKAAVEQVICTHS